MDYYAETVGEETYLTSVLETKVSIPFGVRMRTEKKLSQEAPQPKQKIEVVAPVKSPSHSALLDQVLKIKARQIEDFILKKAPMYEHSTPELLEALLGKSFRAKDDPKAYKKFLDRIRNAHEWFARNKKNQLCWSTAERRDYDTTNRQEKRK